MPILTVEIVLRPGEHLRPELAGELAMKAGAAFGSAPGTTWVRVVPIAAEHYAENSRVREETYPVLVSILKAKMPDPESLRAEVTQLTREIAEVCGRAAENTHLIYLPEGSGRVAFGGDIVSG